MKQNKELEKGISEIAGALTDPIIVMPGGWGDTLPDWLKQAITLERLTMNIKSLRGEPMTGTDAEACAYLYTAGLTAPMDSDWAEIYLYISTQVCRRHKQVDMPADIAVESISDYRLGELLRLKAWLYRQRVRVRQDHARMERREQKEREHAQREAEQPALFKF